MPEGMSDDDVIEFSRRMAKDSPGGMDALEGRGSWIDYLERAGFRGGAGLSPRRLSALERGRELIGKFAEVADLPIGVPVFEIPRPTRGLGLVGRVLGVARPSVFLGRLAEFFRKRGL